VHKSPARGGTRRLFHEADGEQISTSSERKKTARRNRVDISAYALPVDLGEPLNKTLLSGC
jgi:hypothetical protein